LNVDKAVLLGSSLFMSSQQIWKSEFIDFFLSYTLDFWSPITLFIISESINRAAVVTDSFFGTLGIGFTCDLLYF